MNTATETPLPPSLIEALTALADARTALIASDFDGTLADIVEDPAAARPLPGAIEALENLAALDNTNPLIISGRGMDDLKRLTNAPGTIHLIASHGAEFSPNTPGGTPDPEIDHDLAQRVEQDLRAILRLDPGLQLERKATGYALHYRRARSRANAQGAVERALQGPAKHPGVRVKHGKEVVELTLTDATKGKALAAVRDALNADIALFVGDDTTDEEGFAELKPHDITVKVGEGDTIARHRIDSPAAAVALLQRCARLRNQT